MNKNIKRIIALTLITSAFSTISAITFNSSFDFMTKPVYASTYSPSTGELKSLTIKSSNGDSLDLRDGYNSDKVKLSDDKEYYAKLTDDSEGIKINAEVKGSDYVVRIFTSDKTDATGIKPGEEIPLGKGNTTIYIRTYESLSAYRKAKDEDNDVTKCEEEYTINIKKTTESDYEDNTQDSIYLENIQLSKGDITFLKQRTSYDIKIDSSVDEIKITAKPENENDRVRIDGDIVDESDSYKKTISLDSGENEIKIKVTDDEDNQRTYTLNVTRGNSSSNQDNIYLDELKVDEGKLDFSKDTSSYTLNVDESVSKITIGAEPEDEEYLVTIDGDKVNSDDDYENTISLSKGKNIVKVVIEDEVNDKKRTYTLTINRGASVGNDDADDTGKKNGWTQTEEGWKYADENGNILKSSWLFDKEQKVYCYLNEKGLRVTGWFKDKEKWYLLDNKGAMLTGWQYNDGKWYLLDKTSGEMKTGWIMEEVTAQSSSNSNNTSTNSTVNTTNGTSSTNIDISDNSDSSNTSTSANGSNTNANSTSNTKIQNWYYLSSDGSMKTGWFQDKGKWYYFNKNGVMQKGWVIDSNSKYYLGEDGAMVTGTKTIDKKEYKFTSSGVLII